MKKNILIGCGKKKLKTSKTVEAKDLYISPLFRYNLKYASQLEPDNIFILSAHYGLVNLDQRITYYNKTLNAMAVVERRKWSNSILESLKQKTDIESDLYIFLAGNKYREFLIPKLRNYEIPFKGLSIGRQLQELKLRTR